MKGDPSSTRAPTPSSDRNGSLGIPLGSAAQAEKKPKRKKRTKYITEKQAMNLIEALHFAEHVGFPLNVSVDINWDMFSGFLDDQTRFAKCQERISKWSQRQRFPLTLIWVREIGENGAPNTHVLIHVPEELFENGQVRSALERALESEGELIDETAIFIQRAYNPFGKLLYGAQGAAFARHGGWDASGDVGWHPHPYLLPGRDRRQARRLLREHRSPGSV